jgi:hypothetical protein
MLLARRTLKGRPIWTVERVIETGRVPAPVTIPGVQAIATASDDEAFARACDRIDKRVWVSRDSRR